MLETTVTRGREEEMGKPTVLWLVVEHRGKKRKAAQGAIARRDD